MSASDQRSTCQHEAFKLLKLADQYHEEARATVAPVPRIDKYYDASRHYEMAARRFEKCLADVATDMERRRLTRLSGVFYRDALCQHCGSGASHA